MRRLKFFWLSRRLDLMTEGWAWGLARQMLECALALVGSQRRVRDDKPDEGAGEGP